IPVKDARQLGGRPAPVRVRAVQVKVGDALHRVQGPRSKVQCRESVSQDSTLDLGPWTLDSYFAYSTARVSRTPLTLIWPGYWSVSSIFLETSRARRIEPRSSISLGRTMIRTSRPAWMAKERSTPGKLFATCSSASSRLM